MSRLLRVKLASFALACACLGGCAHPAAPVLTRDRGFVRGVALGVFGPADEIDYSEKLREVRALGATHVSLVVTLVQDDVRSNAVRAEAPWSPSPALVRALVEEAHANGLQTLVFPILRLLQRTPEQWRGNIAPTDPAAWFDAYDTALAPYAEAAAAAGSEAFCVGSELVSTEPFEARWRQTIAKVKARFGGRTIYSANWDRYDHVPFWDAVDVVGISAYWELTRSGTRPTREALVEAWRPIREKLATFAAAHHKPLLFTEVGYPSVRGAAYAPWNDFLTGAVGAEDPEAQRRLYEAFAESWGEEQALSGVYFWVWFHAGGSGDRGYTPRGKGAEFVVRRWFTPLSRAPEVR